ncbi:hypothetical protein JCGZ_10793 [Jatropha curcas]|uniref:Uncharacterized protein n=1 Tax=Jatropha curcas TaxID=180498 RepID=A0A067LHI0_JATCU|nr:hypothetical protein JCGZ_10793 [Jatropha curcas]
MNSLSTSSQGKNPAKTPSREEIPRRNQVRNEFCINIKSGRNPEEIKSKMNSTISTKSELNSAPTASRKGIPHQDGKEFRTNIKTEMNSAPAEHEVRIPEGTTKDLIFPIPRRVLGDT